MAMLILDRLRANEPSYSKLKLVYPPTEICRCSGDIQQLIAALGANHTVTYVLLEGAFCRNLTNTDYQAVLNAVGKLPALQDLEIWSSPVPVAALCQAVEQAVYLRRLGLGMVTLMGDMTAAGLKCHPSLRTFCLSDFSLQDHTIRLDHLFLSLATCPALERVEIFANRSNSNSNTNSNTAVPWSPSSLAALLYATPNLTLRRVGLAVDAVRLLPVHFKRQQRLLSCNDNKVPWAPRLRVLDLNENQLKDAGSVLLIQALAEHGFAVKELILRANEITATGCRGLVDQLLVTVNRSSTLEKLNLACNELKEAAAASLADLIRNHAKLKQLELHRTSLTDVGCTLLADAVATNHVLQSLGLSSNQFTDVSYVVWASALSQNDTLQSISLQADDKQITTTGAHALLHMIREHNYQLDHIGTSLSASYDRAPAGKGWYHSRINMYLRLNHAGRRILLQGKAASRSDWLQTVLAVQDDLNAILYLVQINPTLWLQLER